MQNQPNHYFVFFDRLSGRKNIVYTGVAIKFGNHIEKFTESSEVYFAELTDEQIRAYIDTGEPL